MGKLADHVEDHAALSPEKVVLVASPGTESSYQPALPQSVNDSLVSQHNLSRPTQRRHAYLPFLERIWWLLTGSSSSSRFLRWYASVGAKALGANVMACEFN